MQQVLCQLRSGDDCRSETARWTNKPALDSSRARTIAGQERSAMHRCASRFFVSRLLLLQLLPRILHRGAYRFDLDVGELAADPAHFAQRSEERRVGKECRSRWS